MEGLSLPLPSQDSPPGALLPLLLAPGAPAAPAARRPLLVVYGDSFTAGHPPSGGMGEQGWPAQLGWRLGADVAVNGLSGTGFVQVAWGSTFPYQVCRLPVDDADVAIVFGGVNDLNGGQPADAVGLAARVTVDLIRRRSPRTEVLVVGPEWPAWPLTAAVSAVRDAIAAEVTAAGGHHVDPTTWFQGRGELFAVDGLHLTDAGHRWLADRLTPHVARLLKT